ncbi:hypothetical protein [Endozoicomonas sp. Mp262]|uniref:hypothetical protein n=1 Tax=Endozoicomonas sp. Mp262 TaxID=2919499 RepID=UPI0021D96E39
MVVIDVFVNFFITVFGVLFLGVRGVSLYFVVFVVFVDLKYFVISVCFLWLESIEFACVKVICFMAINNTIPIIFFLLMQLKYSFLMGVVSYLDGSDIENLDNRID